MQNKLKFSLLVTASLAHIQPIIAEEGTELGSVIITATRVEENTNDVAVSIQTKDKEEIELDNVVLQKDLLNSLAGVRITQTGSTVGHMTGIRLPSNTSPYYLMLQDGIPIQSSGFFNHNGLAYTNYSSAGSTEVLKGAGTALYGSDAVGATINVQSKKIPDENNYMIRTEGGDDGFYRLGASAGGELSENTAALGSFSHAEGDGWRDHTAFKRSEISLQHINDLNDTNSLKTIFTANQSRAEMADSLRGRDAFENETTTAGNASFIAKLNQGIPLERKFDFTRLSTEWTNETSQNTTLSTIAYLRSNRNRYIATWENNLPQNDSKEKTVGLMLKADINKKKLRYIAGLDAEYTKSKRTYDQLFDFVPTRFGSPVDAGKIYDYDVGYFAVAPYLRTEFNISDKLQLGGGLRYDVNSYEYTNNLTDGQYANSTYSRASDDIDPTFNHLSPKFDLSYKPSENQLLYARYANGFRIPQASRLYSLRTNNLDFTLEPETSDTFEIGFKAASKNHELSTAIYQMTIDDTIVRREDANRDRFYINAGKTTHKGIELSLSSKLSDQFSTKLAYSYSKHEYDNDEVYGNNQQASAPNDIANARLIYKPKQAKGLTTMLEWEHVGSWWMDDQNTQKYEGYDVGNVKVSYAPNKNLKLFAKVNNITDKLYAEASTISFGSERYTPAAPRQFFAGIEYNW